MSEYNYRRYHFDSVSDAMERMCEKSPWESMGKDNDRSSRSGSEEFTGTKSWEESIDLFENGWQKGLEQMSDAVAVTATAVSGQSQAILMDVAGAYPVPPLAAAGDPFSMVSFNPWERTFSPIVKIQYEIGANWQYKAEQFTSYGAAMMTIINQLELANFRVELVLNWTSSAGSKTRTFSITLKKTHEEFDLDLMGYTMTHPSFFRRQMFALMESYKETESEFKWGYGYPDTIRKSHVPEDVIYLQGPQQFSRIGPELQDGASCLKALLPIVQERLLDKNAKMPPLTEWCDVHGLGQDDGTEQ